MPTLGCALRSARGRDRRARRGRNRQLMPFVPAHKGGGRPSSRAMLGTQANRTRSPSNRCWIPAFAGMNGWNWLSLLRLIEVLEVRRPLVLLGGHQLAGTVEHVVLVLDVDLKVVLVADRLDPDRLALATHALGDCPWPSERVVVNRDLIVEDIWIRFVEIEP